MRYTNTDISQPALDKQSTVYLKIPMEYAGLLRQVLRMGFRQAWERSNPCLFGGSGLLLLALADLHESLDYQLRLKGVPE